MTQPALLVLALAAYACAAAFAVRARLRRCSGRDAPTAAFSIAGVALHSAFVAVRAAATGVLPFASRFEAMLLYALAVEAAGLAVYLALPRASVKAATDAVAALLITIVLLRFGFEPGGAMNPILNSPYFAVHILLAFAGYGVLSAGLAWSIAALFDRTVSDAPGVPVRLADGVTLLLGAGILSGAMWADESWGTYWNWDPKESWALLAWTAMMAYPHVSGRHPRRAVTVLFYALAYATMMFTFVGINLLKWGAHRY